MEGWYLPLDLSAKRPALCSYKNDFSIDKILAAKPTPYQPKNCYQGLPRLQHEGHNQHQFHLNRLVFLKANLQWKHYMQRKVLNQQLMTSQKSINSPSAQLVNYSFPFYPLSHPMFLKFPSLESNLETSKKVSKPRKKSKFFNEEALKQNNHTYSKNELCISNNISYKNRKPNHHGMTFGNKAPFKAIPCNQNPRTNNNKPVSPDEALVTLEDSYECKLCHTCYWSPVALAGHDCSKMVKKHFKCETCAKVFNSSANLASHKRWHTL